MCRIPLLIASLSAVLESNFKMMKENYNSLKAPEAFGPSNYCEAKASKRV